MMRKKAEKNAARDGNPNNRKKRNLLKQRRIQLNESSFQERLVRVKDVESETKRFNYGHEDEDAKD